MLLEAGANLEARFQDGQTPLHYAGRAAVSETTAVIVAALLQAGADLEARNAFGLHATALCGACRVAWNRCGRSGVPRRGCRPECAGQVWQSAFRLRRSQRATQRDRCLLEAQRRPVSTVEVTGWVPTVTTHASFLLEAISAQPFDVVDHRYRFLGNFSELVNEVTRDLAAIAFVFLMQHRDEWIPILFVLFHPIPPGAPAGGTVATITLVLKLSIKTLSSFLISVRHFVHGHRRPYANVAAIGPVLVSLQFNRGAPV